MIKGVGIDIIENGRIAKLLKFESRFLNKVLHETEIKTLSEYTLDKKRVQFIASRWALKESLVKATKNKYIVFNKVYLNKLNDEYCLKIEKHDTNLLNKHEYLDSNSDKKDFIEERAKDINSNIIVEKYNEINHIVDEINKGTRMFMCSVSHEENYSTAIVINTILI